MLPNQIMIPTVELEKISHIFRYDDALVIKLLPQGKNGWKVKLKGSNSVFILACWVKVSLAISEMHVGCRLYVSNLDSVQAKLIQYNMDSLTLEQCLNVKHGRYLLVVNNQKCKNLFYFVCFGLCGCIYEWLHNFKWTGASTNDLAHNDLGGWRV